MPATPTLDAHIGLFNLELIDGQPRSIRLEFQAGDPLGPVPVPAGIWALRAGRNLTVEVVGVEDDGGLVFAIDGPTASLAVDWARFRIRHDGADVLGGKVIEAEPQTLPGEQQIPIAWAEGGGLVAVSAVIGAGGGPATPTGPAGGDLAGSFPNPTVPGLADKADAAATTAALAGKADAAATTAALAGKADAAATTAALATKADAAALGTAAAQNVEAFDAAGAATAAGNSAVSTIRSTVAANLNDLAKVAAAINNDPNFYTTLSFAFGGALNGKQDLNANLTALSGLSGVADRVPYFTGAGAMALATQTAYARTLIAAANAAAARTVLGAWPMPDLVTTLPNPIYIAHRGGAGIAPEETMEAFRTSASSGAHALEMDVQPLSDGTLALMHDTTVDRTTDGTGNVAAFTAPSWRALNAAAKFPPWNGRVIPPAMLQEAIAEFGGKQLLMIEPKDSTTATAIMDLLDKYSLRDSVIMQASAQPNLIAIKARGYKCFYWWGGTPSTGDIATAVANGADYFGVETAQLDAKITELVATGKPVFGFTVNRRHRKTEMLALSVDGFLTDQPQYLQGSTAQRTLDSWRQGVLGHGWNQSLSNLTPATISAGAVSVIAASNQYACVGEVSPIANAAGTYTIDIDVALETAAGGGAVAFFIAPDDKPYAQGVGVGAGYPNGWMAYLRNTGIMSVFKTTAPSTATAVGSSTAQATAALADNVFAHLRLAVTATGLTLTRTDSGGFTPITVTDSAFRGGYLFVGKTGTASTAKFKNLAIT